MLLLHAAIEQMDEQLVEELLSRGADPNAADPDLGGFRPLHLAVDIEAESACRRFDLGDVNAAPRAVLTRALLKAGAKPDLPDDAGNTARSLAKQRLHAEALELFGPETS